MFSQIEIPGTDRADEPDLQETLDNEDIELTDGADEDIDAPDADPVADPEDAAEEDDEEEDAQEEEEDLSSIRDRAAQMEQWLERYSRDPQGFVTAFYQAMSPAEQQAFVSRLQQQPAPVEFEPQTPVEEHYVKHRQYVEELPRFAEQVSQHINEHQSYLHDSQMRLAAAEAQIAALSELLELSIPALDLPSVDKAVRGGKTYKDAIAAYSKDLTKAVRAKKQAAKPRPITPGQEANPDLTTSLKGADMETIFRKLRAQGL